MAGYADQEEVEKLKAWWKSYGGSLLAGVAVGVALLVGQKYWDSYREGQYAAASERYRELVAAVQGRDLDAARRLGGELLERYRRTPYAGLGALVLGRHEAEAGNLAAAREALGAALRHGDDAATEHAARLNLARVLAAEGKTDEALTLLAVRDMAGFESQYDELRGDLLRRQGRPAQARAAYEAALKRLAPGSAYRQVLEMKRDAAGVPTP